MSKTFKRFSTCFVCLLIVCAIIVGVLINGVKRVGAENDKTVFSSKINALTNAYGETVNILPEDVRLWNESTDADTDYLNSLYEYSDLHKQFQTDVNNDNSDENLPGLYRQTDVFNPINNVLKWESSLENVESYKVRVSYDNKFTKCILIKENAATNKEVTIENPLVGTTYYWQVIATLSGGDKVYSQIFDFTTENTLRTVTVDGVSNTRDIGGYQTAYGYVKQGLVYRSARLESITTEEGLDTFINKLGINTDLDLRGVNEANSGKNRYNPLKFDSNDGYPSKNYYPYDTPVYTISNEALWPNVKNIMTVFTDKNNYPIDFHCAVGRDRTGTVAALLKSLLGYNEIDIINDYFTSMFATTGAWDKSASSGQKDVFLGVLSYLKSFSGETLADKTANYLITKCGMTQGDIDLIRNIMTGKPGYEVSIPADNTTVDTDNYSGYNIVTCEKFGVKTRVFVVENGNKIPALDAYDGYIWTLDGVEYDFNTIINNKDIRLIAQKVPTQLKYTVKIVSTGSLDGESSEYVNAGDNFDFALLNKSGYSYIVLSADGEIITSLKPESNTTINVIYVQS